MLRDSYRTHVCLCLLSLSIATTTLGCGRYGYDHIENLPDFIDCADASETGHCYQLSLAPKDWQAAQDACQDDLGPTAHLVTIGGLSENEWARQYAESIPVYPGQDNPNQRKRMWTAGNDLATVTVWTWTTGEPFEYENWREGEPDRPGEEQCMIVLGEYDGLWDDRPCDREYEYLCEREAL